MSNVNSVERIHVWDRFVRIFHWSLVTCVLMNFFVIDDGDTFHQWLGYLATGLVLSRIVWGFIGSRHARFADFFPTPARLQSHLRCLLSGTPDFHAGHNPLGALMILLLIALVLSLGATGYMQTTDLFWGEEWLQELHELLAGTLIGLAGLHALAALVMSHVERTNLIKAMFAGVKIRARK